jgi:hypoxanthine phosphoribosyltransferase
MLNLNVLIDEQTIYKRIDELAKQIQEDYGNEELICICILKGSFPFTWELSKRINKNNITFEFMEISSYGNALETSGKINVKKDISCDISSKNVLIIEDIIDSGTTLSYLKEYLSLKTPKSIKIATLLSKPSRRVVDVPVEYIGFTIEDKFVLGFGLDMEQKYRNLPYIGYVTN